MFPFLFGPWAQAAIIHSEITVRRFGAHWPGGPDVSVGGAASCQ